MLRERRTFRVEGATAVREALLSKGWRDVGASAAEGADDTPEEPWALLWRNSRFRPTEYKDADEGGGCVLWV